MVVGGIDEEGKRGERELPAPPPLCEVVSCHDEELEKEVSERVSHKMRKMEEEVDGIYSESRKFANISPYLLNEYYFCPRLFWLEVSKEKKFMTRDAIKAAARGEILQERYGEELDKFYRKYLKENYDVKSEYEVKDGEFVGRVDFVLEFGGKRVPIEVKTGEEMEGHIKQLQAYMAMMDAPIGYLVYGDKVVAVDPDSLVLDELRNIGEVVKWLRKVEMGERRPSLPPPPRDCRQCEYKAVCEKYGVIPPTFTS